jgi:hypothetical protein
VIHVPKIAAPFLALALAATMAGCAATAQTPPSGTPIAVSPSTEGAITSYLRTVRVTRPGAFAVSPDGRNSFYTYCDDTVCMTSNYSMPALRGCQSLAGTPCIVLYVRNEQRLPFTRDENAAPGGQHGSQEQPEINFNSGRT